MASMHPVFTVDAVHWYHTSSTMSNNGQAYVSAGYEEVNNIAAVTGVDANNDGDYEDEGDTAPMAAVNYYLKNKFQIKSTGSAQDIYVKSFTIVSGGAQDFDPSIRALIKTEYATLIFAPIGTHSGSEGILAATAADDDVDENLSFTFIAVDTLSAKVLEGVTSTPADVEIYFYYDGEDVACKSDNIANPFAATKFNVVFTSVVPTT